MSTHPTKSPETGYQRNSQVCPYPCIWSLRLGFASSWETTGLLTNSCPRAVFRQLFTSNLRPLNEITGKCLPRKSVLLHLVGVSGSSCSNLEHFHHFWIIIEYRRICCLYSSHHQEDGVFEWFCIPKSPSSQWYLNKCLSRQLPSL